MIELQMKITCDGCGEAEIIAAAKATLMTGILIQRGWHFGAIRAECPKCATAFAEKGMLDFGYHYAPPSDGSTRT